MKKSTIIKDDPIFIYASIREKQEKNILVPFTFEDKLILIYDTHLEELLTTQKLRVVNLDTGKKTIINGTGYQKDYIKGYFEGRKYFESKFPEEAFFKDPKSYVEDLGQNYIDAKQPFTLIMEGWEKAITNEQLTYFNHKIIENNAFKAGQLSKFDEFKKIRHSAFKDFEKLNYVTEKDDSEFSSKSISIAYLYLYKKGIYPIPEITVKGKKLEFYEKLSSQYGLSKKSIKNDWPYMEEKNNRIKHPEIIKVAIGLLRTFSYPNIAEVLKLAEAELKEAELRY